MDPMADVQRRAHVTGGPSELVLYTVIRNKDGSGAHTALMIDGAQRVLWDPAGSFRHPHVPERGDLLYGVDDTIRNVYIDYHARETFRVVEQRIPVSRAVADEAMRLAAAEGAAMRATCAQKTSGILRALPGFQDVRRTPFPGHLMRSVRQLPDVTERVITDDDADDNHNVLFVAAERARLDEE